MARTLSLTLHEYDALAWIADRYTSAAVLYDELERQFFGMSDDLLTCCDEREFVINPTTLDRYIVEVAAENGARMVPPRSGGTLASKLLALVEGIL